MRRHAAVLIAASLLLSACGAINITSASDSESAAVTSPVSPPGEPEAAAPQTVPDNPSVAVERSVPAVSPGAPAHLAEPTPAPTPVPPSTITPLIVAQSAEVESAAVSPAPTTVAPAPTTVAPAPIVTSPPDTAPVPVPVITSPPPTTAPPTTAPPITAPPATAPPLAPAGLTVDGTSAARFVSDINGLRSGLGLPALTRSAELDSLALGWATTMAADHNMRHSNIIHSLVNQGTWTGAAENVGYGSNETIVFNALVASPSHYTNMANGAYTHVGVAVVAAGDLIWTAHLFVG